MKRRYFYRKNNIIFRTVCVFIVFLIILLLTDAKIRPAVYQLAEIEACSVCTERINTAVEQTLSTCAPSYSDIIKVNYGSSNEITGITTDIVKINLFKSQIANAIDSTFTKNPRSEIRVSLGNASGLVFLSDIGPHVKINAGFISSTKTDFINNFESAGINQTLHSIILDVETTVLMSLSGKRIQKTVNTSFCIAQTVIIGGVPDVMVE